jgi:8-amino-7-oxononanoate synthase
MRIAAACDNERNALAGLSAFLRGKLRDVGFAIGTGDTQILPIILGEDDRAVRFAGLLNDAGFGIRAIRPPSVPAGTSRLRISLNAKLSADVLDRFVRAVVSVRDREPVLVPTVRS